MNNPLNITVIIPAYNAERFICRAIDSAINQSYSPSEIIVVDDGSADSTREIVRSTYGKKIKLLECKKNKGAAHARNVGIEAATGGWIAFLDADDEWQVDHLARLFRIVQKYSLNWCCGQHLNINYNNKIIRRPHKKWQVLHRESAYFNNFFLAWSLDPPIITSGMIVQRNLLVNVGMFDPTLDVAEDIDLWFKIAYLEPRIGLTQHPTVKHFITKGSLCATYQNRARLLMQLLKKHMEISSSYDRSVKSAFCYSARKIARWIVNCCIKEYNFNILTDLIAKYHWLIKQDFPFLCLLNGFTYGICLYCFVQSLSVSFRIRLRNVYSNLKI